MQTHTTPEQETTQVPEYTVDDHPTIYLVDPDVRHRDAVAALMSRLGYHTENFHSAEDLLESLGTPAPRGCVISEMRLPGISGVELFAALRERRIGLPFIILTGDPDITRAVDALRSKVADYVVKPVVERDLIARVRGALRTLDDGRVKSIG
jgi:FixJ family two-component response regulator